MIDSDTLRLLNLLSTAELVLILQADPTWKLPCYANDFRRRMDAARQACHGLSSTRPLAPRERARLSEIGSTSDHTEVMA